MKKMKTWWSGFLILAFLICGCSAGSSSRIRIGCSKGGEGEILCWMYKELAARQGLPVELVEVSPGIKNLQPALENDSLQVGVEFTDSAWKTVLHHGEPYRSSDLTLLSSAYNDLNLTWVELPQVSDHYLLAVTKKVAKTYDLKTISDLVEVQDKLVLGAPTMYFEQEDGYPLMEKVYGLSVGKTVNLPESQYKQALLQGNIDVIPARTLDGSLQDAGVVFLEDDLKAYENSYAGIVLNKDAIRNEPRLVAIARILAREIRGEQLVQASHLVSSGLATPQEASLLILKSVDLIREKTQGK